AVQVPRLLLGLSRAGSLSRLPGAFARDPVPGGGRRRRRGALRRAPGPVGPAAGPRARARGPVTARRTAPARRGTARGEVRRADRATRRRVVMMNGRLRPHGREATPSARLELGLD